MNNKNLMKVGVGIGVLALLYFAFKKKGTSAKSSKVTEANPLASSVGKIESAITADINDKMTIKAGDSPKDVKIKKLFADMMANPPKNEQEAMARATKFGLTKADIDAYNSRNNPTTLTGFDSILSEERTSGSNSRIKPTSVSGLVVAKRPRNYGTAQRPTRTLIGRKVNPMATTQTMDFDGNDDVLGSIM
jgi:hypothetical protein